MAGIVSFGAHIPYYRLRRDEIAKATRTSSLGGERTVASFDEDSVTMAVAAALNCIAGRDRSEIDTVFFASTTPPYAEKQSASLVAAALNLRRDVNALDIGNSLRAGTNALKAALEAVQSGAIKTALVVAADCRAGQSGSQFEQDFGDGAAALLISNRDPAATVDCSYTCNDELWDQWRVKSDDSIHTWETRYVLQHGYLKNMKQAASSLMAKCGLKPQDFVKAAYNSPDSRSHIQVAQMMGLNPKTQLQDSLYDKVGNTGSAFALMLLVAALEQAAPGQRLLLANYGDGCDAFSLMTTAHVGKGKGPKPVKQQLEKKAVLPTYEDYRRFRNLLSSEVTRAPSIPISVPQLWRDRADTFALLGHRCLSCGNIEFPKQRICAYCRSKDKFEEVRLSDKKASVFTYTKDYMTPSINSPVVRCALNYEGGGRSLSQMTDCDPAEIAIDMPVEMTFRRLFGSEDLGMSVYSWKGKPA